jgi:superfamily II DNA or RNA helicase
VVRGYALTSPREAALRVLAHRFGESNAAEGEGDGEHLTFELTDFQQEALERAEAILERRRGVLIADSVGLGKTFIALALAERALRAGGRVLVVTPASLRRDWTRTLRKLAITIPVRHTWGLGGVPDASAVLTGIDANPHVPRALPTLAGGPGTAPFLAWTSHTRLSRGSDPAGVLSTLDLVVVDEAHAFRTPSTRRYRALAELCRTARVALITATPVNNSLADLYALLRLFAGDGDFADLGTPDLAAALRDGEGASALLPVLRAVMVRRTRELVRGREGGAPLASHPHRSTPSLPRFPDRAPPTPVRYALERAYPGFYPSLAALLTSLTLAPFRPGDYGALISPGRASTPVELIHLNFLKRLESSVAALRASVGRMLRFYVAFLSSLEEGRLRTPAAHRAEYGTEGSDAIQLAIEAFTLRPLPPALDRTRLKQDAEHDLAHLRALSHQLGPLTPDADPKLERLRSLLDNEVRGHKVVLFTEFRETACYLWRALLPRGHVGLIDGAGAWLGESAAARQDVIARFAPHANGAREPPPRERIDLLIATDVLAEGLNLQDASHAISYDLPWNPVRLIQRIGRIDRIASPHSTVYPFHFLPEEGLEALLGVVARLRAKLHAIGQSVGGDAPVLESFLERLAAGDPGALDAAESAHPALALEERLRAAYRRARVGKVEKGDRRPLLAVTAAPPDAPHQFLAAFATDSGTRSVLVEEGRAREGDAAADHILLAALEAAAITDPAAPAPTLRRVLHAARRALARGTPRARTAAPLPPTAPGARATRHLLATLAALPGGPTPALCRRADPLLAALARRHDAGTERRIAEALRSTAHPAPATPAAAEAILAALEAALGAADTAPAAPRPPQPSRPRLIAILESRPARD